MSAVILLTMKELLLLEDRYKKAQWRKGDCIEDALGAFLVRIGSALRQASADFKTGNVSTYAVGIEVAEAWQSIEKVSVFDAVGNEAVGQGLLVKLYGVVVKRGNACPYEVKDPSELKGDENAGHEDDNTDADGAEDGADTQAEPRRDMPDAERPDSTGSAPNSPVERWYEGYE